MATSIHAPTGNLPPKAPRIFSEADGQMFDHAIHARVSGRAYHLYEASGGEHGNARAHWLQAQDEVLQRGLEVREPGSWLSINAPLPSVDRDDIEIYLDSIHLFVRRKKGKRTQSADQDASRQGEFFLMENLVTGFDPRSASAAFKDQKLTLMVKKRYPETSTSTQPPSARN